LRGVYEGPGSHGILEVASSVPGVHAVLRAYPEEGYYPALHAALARGETAPVSLSPAGVGGDEGAARDLRAATRREGEARLILYARSEAALLSGAGLPEPEPADPRSPELLLFPWESPLVREAEARDLALAEVVRLCARPLSRSPQPTVNLFAPPAYGPNAGAEVAEMERLLGLLGVGVNARVLAGSSAEDLSRLPQAWASVVLSREAAETASLFLQDEFGVPRVTTPPIGSAGTGAVLRAVGELCGLDARSVRRAVLTELSGTARLPWYARLAVPETFRGRRATLFGDLTYGLGLGYTLAREVGMEVAWAGTYLLHLEQDFSFHAHTFTDEAFAEDDPDRVAARIEDSHPDLLVGTRLEEPVAHSLGIPFLPLCPPAYGRPFVERPLMGYTGSSALADALDLASRRPRSGAPGTAALRAPASSGLTWTEEALLDLEDVPSFLRGRARRLAEEHAREVGSPEVTSEILAESRSP
jgi:light-independent protochlorophyllide reductase subunit B